MESKAAIKNTRKPRSPQKSQSVQAHHSDHSAHLKRLSRVKGQIEGIEKMILEKRYCPDIINQVKAACAALKAVESEIFRSHLRGCVKSAFQSQDSFASEDKIQEILKMVY